MLLWGLWGFAARGGSDRCSAASVRPGSYLAVTVMFPVQTAAVRSRIALLGLLPLLLAFALPAGACERHLQGHQTSTDSAQEASSR